MSEYGMEAIEGVDSKFNGAFLQIARINILQERINNANLNLLSFDHNIQIWNYQVVFNSLNSLYHEARPKCSDKEKFATDLFRETLEYAMEKYPPHQKKHNLNSSSKQTLTLNDGHWKILKRYLINYEVLVRDLLDAHKLNSPPATESDMF